MKHFKIITLTILVSTLLLWACKKEEGTGGMASIRGQVINTDYSPNFENKIDAYNLADEDVFIVYGDDESYSNKITTSHDGTFVFEYLRPGDYTVFVYSDDSSKSSTTNNIPVEIKVSLDKKENKNLGQINVIDELDYDDGAATIYGKVYKINYNATYTSINEEYYAPDEDVYLVYGDDATYFERVKTRGDGSYTFTNLLKGKYRIYVFSEDPTQTVVSNTIEIFKDTTITSNNQNIVLPDLVIAD
jgi:membrane-anchored protein YejM (alkaline phosphatase superfamily)